MAAAELLPACTRHFQVPLAFFQESAACPACTVPQAQVKM